MQALCRMAFGAFGGFIAAATFAQPFGVPPRDVIWRLDVKTLPPNAFSRQRVQFSPDGAVIGVVYQPSEARLLSAGDGSIVRELPGPVTPASAYSIGFSSTAQVAVGRFDGVEVVDPATGASEPFRCECGAVDAVAFSPDGSLLAFQPVTSPYRPRRTIVFAVGSHAQIATLDAFSNRAFVAFSADGRQLISSAFSHTDDRMALGYRVWNIADSEPVREYEGEPRANFGVMGAGVMGGRWVAAYGRSNAIEMRSIDDSQVIWTASLLPPNFDLPRVLGAELDRVEIAPNGEYLVSYESPIATEPNSHVAGSLVLRETANGRVIAAYDVPGVTDISIAPDSRSFVYATGSGAVHIARVRAAGLDGGNE